MFLGHFGVALAAKRVHRGPSLGTCILAAQLADLLWPVFLLLGIERVRIVPGLMAASPLDFEWYPYTHSLAAALFWSAALGLAYFAVRRSSRSATVVGALVFSHWLLDLPMHRPDLPLWPGSSVHLGFGLWNSIPASLIIELAVLAAGAALYLRATRARTRVGTWAFAGMVLLLIGFYVSSLFGPPPPDERTLAITVLALWLFVPWGYWIDRHREDVPAPKPYGRGA